MDESKARGKQTLETTNCLRWVVKVRVPLVRSIEVSMGKTHKPARLILVDDHRLARESLQDMLADESDVEVVGEASNGREALALCANLRPDLVLMDVRMPKMDGLAATREIKQMFPRIAVMVVTMHENTDYLLEALKAGAAGYILKDALEHEVVGAVRQVLNGESPLDTELAARLLRRLAAESEKREHKLEQPRQYQGTHVELLTQREIEVLDRLKLGLTNLQIAQELFISAFTVERDVENIIVKLGVSDRTQAVVRALELGLLRLSE